MKCPHCTVAFFDDWVQRGVAYGSQPTEWHYKITLCPNCRRYIILIGVETTYSNIIEDWKMIFPNVASRGPVSPQVPAEIALDYIEACDVLPISPKASAALSRRCLQAMLHSHGYHGRDLSKEIDLLPSEPDTTKSLPATLRMTLDGIRNFGNFSAHPITDQTTLQIIDVEPHEAEWCLETIEELFDHFYVRPAEAAARKAALDAKLAAAGKPLSK